MAPAGGTTSFDLTVSGSIEGRPVFGATLTGVNVTPGTRTPTPAPKHVRPGRGRRNRSPRAPANHGHGVEIADTIR